MNDVRNLSKRHEPFTRRMAFSLKMEEVAISAFSIYLLVHNGPGLPLWLWILLFFSPDLAMLGYVFSLRTGALAYNLLHHRAISLFIVTVGLIVHSKLLIAIGLVIFAHSSFDRVFGFGLKYDDSFNHTHLGWGGRNLPR